MKAKKEQMCVKLPVPRNMRGETFEQEQARELEDELQREILGLGKRARREKGQD